MDRLEQLLAFHAEDPGDSFVRFAIASELIKRGNDAEARKYFEDLLSSDPDYVGAYYHLGKLLERTDGSPDAIDVYRKGIEVATRLSDFHAKAELRSALLEAEGLGFE